MKKEERKLIDFLQTELGKTIELKKGVLNCYSEEINVDDLSKVLRIPSSLIISFFWRLGKSITKNQSLNFELVNEFCKSDLCKSKKINVNVVAKEQVEINQIIGNYLKNNTKSEKRASRTPIISVMGHIDHGKSTLLDTIRNTQDQKKEEGGITQKINIYPVEFEGKKITFLDTPGHNVFLKMRERGASFTDLVVLVIAAEDGVMPQTVEVIEYIHKYKIPTIAFINNKRKEHASEKNLDKIKSQLQDKGLTSVEWGGDTTILSGSAINKDDTNNLLENILLLSEVYDWKSDFDCSPNGIILDSYVNNKKGIVNTLLVKNGFLKNRDNIFINGESGKIKKIIDFSDKELVRAEPGDIVQVFGLDFESEPGDNFLVINDESLVKKIKRIIPAKSDSKKFSQANAISNESLPNSKSLRKNINLILITDSQSSLEALENIVKSSSTENILFNPIYSEVGDLNGSVMNLAKITQSSVLLFNIKVSQQKNKELKDNEIKWFGSSIIYKIKDGLEDIEKSFREKKKVEKIIGVAEIKKIFYFSQVGNIAGCQVLSGTINRNHFVNVFRKEDKIFSGKISSLQRDKNNIKEINKGQECGIVINNFNEFKVDDRIISYSLVDEENND
ncbi:MAG: Translation initiation factor IF-2 [Mycoplasmataceae bacterium]|nr:MAG: Translation initiation factor IF-2 [Mycoplasmataceae bacterium]